MGCADARAQAFPQNRATSVATAAQVLFLRRSSAASTDFASRLIGSGFPFDAAAAQPTRRALSRFQSRSAAKSRAIQRISQSTYSQCDVFFRRSPYGPAAIFAPVNALPSATRRARSISAFSLSYRSRRFSSVSSTTPRLSRVADGSSGSGGGWNAATAFRVAGTRATDASSTAGVVVSRTHSSSSSDSTAAAAAASFARFASAAFAAAPL